MWRCGDKLFHISSPIAPSKHLCLCLCILCFAVHHCWVEGNDNEYNKTHLSKKRDEGIIEGILLFTAGKGAPLFYTFFETTEPSVCISYIFGTMVIFTFTLVSISISASQNIKVSMRNRGGAQEGLRFSEKKFELQLYKTTKVLQDFKDYFEWLGSQYIGSWC